MTTLCAVATSQSSPATNEKKPQSQDVQRTKRSAEAKGDVEGDVQAEAPPVLVHAFRVSQDPFEFSRSVNVLSQEYLTRRNQNSILDSIDRTIGVWVEKRTATTSDPVIRGLSGANILALIDGNPLSSFWGEGGFAGDDMYGKVEAESVERIEIIRGPASVQYGANALGGVINFITRRPTLDFTRSGADFGGRLKGSYDTVNHGTMIRADAEAATSDLRMRVGGTWRDLNDGQGGEGVGELSPSGGEDLNFDLNSEYRLGEGEDHFYLNVQSVHRRDLARYYRPTQRNENDRVGIDLGYRSSHVDATEGLEGRVYYQDKEDRRMWWNSGDEGVAKWRTVSTDWSYKSDEMFRGHQIVTGLTARMDEGESPDDEQFTVTTPSGAVSKAAPDQEWYNLGVFLQDDWRCLPWLTLTMGARYDYFLYESRPDALYTPPVGDRSLDHMTEKEGAWTGGLGAVVMPHEDWRVSASWTRGFRLFAPKFGISKHGYGVLVPTGLLDPTTADSYELALRHRSEVFETSLAGYYVDFRGFQNPVSGTFQGQPSYDYNGNNTIEPDEGVFVTTGNGHSTLYGVEWDFKWNPHFTWSVIPDGVYLTGGFMWNYGEDETNNEPMRHTHPARGLLSIGYSEPERDLWYAELTVDIVDSYTRIPSSRLSGDVGYRTNPQDPNSPMIRDDGLPGYTIFDIEMGARVNENLRCGVNLSNLTNKAYRSAHSRMDAFGFNAGIFIEASF